MIGAADERALRARAVEVARALVDDDAQAAHPTTELYTALIAGDLGDELLLAHALLRAVDRLLAAHTRFNAAADALMEAGYALRELGEVL